MFRYVPTPCATHADPLKARSIMGEVGDQIILMDPDVCKISTLSDHSSSTILNGII